MFPHTRGHADGCITQDEMEKLFTSVLRVSVGLRADPATVGALSSVVERSFDGGDGESKGVVADGDSGSGGDSGDAEPTVEEEAMSKVAAEFYLEATARDMVLRCFKEAGAEDGKMTLDQLRAWYVRRHDMLSCCCWAVAWQPLPCAHCLPWCMDVLRVCCAGTRSMVMTHLQSGWWTCRRTCQLTWWSRRCWR